MSTFGGPLDRGMSPTEGLALLMFSDIKVPHFAGLFLPEQPEGRPGLAHRLNPDACYIAMRWDYGKTPVSMLRKGYVLVTNKEGKSVQAIPADWGPADYTDRICDLSPGVAKALDLQTDDTVSVQFFEA